MVIYHQGSAKYYNVGYLYASQLYNAYYNKTRDSIVYIMTGFSVNLSQAAEMEQTALTIWFDLSNRNIETVNCLTCSINWS